MTNKIKITKEQYNRIFASKLISENHAKEKGNDLKAECMDLIKYMYGKKKGNSLDENSSNNAIYDEACNNLLAKGIIIPKDGHYEISRKLGTPENAKEIIEAELKRILASQGQVDEMSNYPPGVNAGTSDAPYNQQDNVGEPEVEPRTVKLAGQLQTIGDDGRENQIVTDGQNLYIITYGDKSEVPFDNNKITKYAQAHEGEIGYGLEDWENGKKRIVQIDPELKNDLITVYKFNDSIIKALNSKGGIEEMTGTGSAGAFTGLFSAEPVKRELNTPDVPVVAETTTASPSTVGPYDANALPGISRSGAYKKTPKTKAEKNTQWAGGSFVDMDSCTKLNNNKVAQNGGCSTGAVDNVVKQKKSGGNINAPSLKGG